MNSWAKHYAPCCNLYCNISPAGQFLEFGLRTIEGDVHTLWMSMAGGERGRMLDIACWMLSRYVCETHARHRSNKSHEVLSAHLHKKNQSGLRANSSSASSVGRHTRWIYTSNVRTHIWATHFIANSQATATTPIFVDIYSYCSLFQYKKRAVYRSCLRAGVCKHAACTLRIMSRNVRCGNYCFTTYDFKFIQFWNEFNRLCYSDRKVKSNKSVHWPYS